ncbi:MAG: hypothetical protein ACLTSZ_11830 [Lachnospiraceae bacterium]
MLVERARPEEAAALLDYLKIIGGETENLSFGAEGVPLSLAEEQDYLRAQCGSADNAQYFAKVDGEIIGTASLEPQKQSHEPSRGIRYQSEKSVVGLRRGVCSDGSDSCLCRGELL